MLDTFKPSLPGLSHEVLVPTYTMARSVKFVARVSCSDLLVFKHAEISWSVVRISAQISQDHWTRPVGFLTNPKNRNLKENSTGRQSKTTSNKNLENLKHFLKKGRFEAKNEDNIFSSDFQSKRLKLPSWEFPKTSALMWRGRG